MLNTYFLRDMYYDLNAGCLFLAKLECGRHPAAWTPQTPALSHGWRIAGARIGVSRNITACP